MRSNEESTPLLSSSRRSSSNSSLEREEPPLLWSLSDEDTSPISLPSRTKKTTTYQFMKTILPFMFLQASVGLCASLQATFYPIEAELKGATASQIGAVFGIIHLSLFIFGPLVGKYLSVWGVKAIFPAGFLIDGSSFIFFGLLQWVDDTNTFLVFSYLIRFIEGVGAAATWTSNLAILMAKFPDRKATVKAWCDASFNFGLTVGPVLGAFMYDYGGFFLPFAVTGTAIIVSGFLVYSVTQFPDMDSGEASQPVLTILSNPKVIIALLTATMGAYSIGTVESTLSPFLKHMGLDVKLIAIAFLVMSFCSVVATPFFGWICDGKISPWLVSCCGCVFMFICFAFLGPVPYLALFNPTLLTVCGSLVAQGFGCAAVLVASFGSAQLAAVAAGLPDSLEVQSAVSGLFTSSFALGNFCGPTVSGILYDAVGFSYNCLILQILTVLVLFFNIFSFLLTPTTKALSKPDVEALTSLSYQLSDRPDLLPREKNCLGIKQTDSIHL